MKKIDLPIAGAFAIEPMVHRDLRGSFVKIYHADTFADFGLQLCFAEEFFSVSHKDVLRGMHFQRPPHQHAKLVSCLNGAVLDVLLDLRRGSPTYGCSISIDLDSNKHRSVYIPAGIAHGFRSMVDDSLVLYRTTTVHNPSSDAGVRWDSFGFDWGLTTPVVSDRDSAFPRWAETVSPFE